MSSFLMVLKTLPTDRKLKFSNKQLSAKSFGDFMMPKAERRLPKT
jgi:hypothetical protein